MKVISNAEYIAAGRTLLQQANQNTIPYIAGGMTLDGMDCQGLCEYLLIQCGVPKSECNLAGSNAHWRNSLKWEGTPEEAVEKFGCVPGGAWVFIWDEEETQKYAGDDEGNASHVGVFLGDCAVHASSSRGCVAESKFVGKTIPNGGWNRVGLVKWINYGTVWEAEGAATEDTGDDTDNGDDSEEINLPIHNIAPVVTTRSAIVTTPDGNPVKMRKEASQQCNTYWHIAHGTHVSVERVRNGWALVTAVCTDGYQRRAYVMDDFLSYTN